MQNDETDFQCSHHAERDDYTEASRIADHLSLPQTSRSRTWEG